LQFRSSVSIADQSIEEQSPDYQSIENLLLGFGSPLLAQEHHFFWANANLMLNWRAYFHVGAASIPRNQPQQPQAAIPTRKHP
jgi:hypothetical protein